MGKNKNKMQKPPTKKSNIIKQKKYSKDRGEKEGIKNRTKKNFKIWQDKEIKMHYNKTKCKEYGTMGTLP